MKNMSRRRFWAGKTLFLASGLFWFHVLQHQIGTVFPGNLIQTGPTAAWG